MLLRYTGPDEGTAGPKDLHLASSSSAPPTGIETVETRLDDLVPRYNRDTIEDCRGFPRLEMQCCKTALENGCYRRMTFLWVRLPFCALDPDNTCREGAENGSWVSAD